MHANALESMRSGSLVENVAPSIALMMAALLALMPLLWLPRLNPLGGLIASVSWFVFVAAAAITLPTVSNVWVPVAGALLAVLLAYPVWVQGEFGLLHRAVLNLVLNAVHYAPAQSSVEVRLVMKAGFVEASVTDHGPGIAAEDLPRLFQRFSRGAAGQTTGTGLGLYFVRTVAEKHGGTVAVESAPKVMTCFTLRLPLAAVASR